MYSIRRSFFTSVPRFAPRTKSESFLPSTILEDFKQGSPEIDDAAGKRRKDSDRSATPLRSSPEQSYTNSDLSLYEPAPARTGRTYSPEDLAFDAKRPLQRKYRESELVDKFEQFQIDPRHQYKSSVLLSEFVTEMGRIRTRAQTGLSAKNQRKLGKAVRRARALSLLPTTARHPDTLVKPNRSPSMTWIAR